MLIPNRKTALLKLRDTVAEIMADHGDDPKLSGQALWMSTTLGQLLQVEDRGFYVRHYRQGRLLAEQGVQRSGSREIADALAVLPADHDDRLDIDIVRDSITSILQVLARITRVLRPDRTEETFLFLGKVVDWENALYVRLDSPGVAPSSSVGVTQENLQAYLRRKFPDRRNVVVTSLKPVHGGNSKQTTLFSMRDDRDGDQELVIRAERKAKLVFLGGTDIRREFSCVRSLFKAGLPVAEPLWVEDDADVFGTRFMVSRRVAGQVVGLGFADMASLPVATQESFLTTLATIHRTQLDTSDADYKASHFPDWTKYSSLQDNTRAWVTYWQEQLERANCPTTPILERAYGWLLDNVPREELQPVIIHGDYGLGNVLVRDEKISAVLDWELSFFGDPAYDFTNFMHRYDRRLLDIYERAGGQRISEYRFFYHLLFRVVKALPALIGLDHIERNPDAPLNFYLLSSFIHHMTGPLNEMLEQAKRFKNQQ